jgi:hypothetical protein
MCNPSAPCKLSASSYWSRLLPRPSNWDELKKEGSFPNFSGSNFAEEDLPSNLISFYAAVNNYVRADLERMLEALNIDQSLEVWKNLKGKTVPNPTWKPIDHNADSCACKHKRLVWPKELDSIIPSAKGYYWRDWLYSTDVKRPSKPLTAWDKK